jgi:NADP-dependent 3-hydroxy acid dehydrogenase YdfG
MADFTQIYHQDTYPTISSSSSANAQTGRTVVVSGASSGIGFAIARSFSNAGASKVIMLGRNKVTLDKAASRIKNAEGWVCDVSSPEDVDRFWGDLQDANVHVDVLVLSAAVATLRNTLQTDAAGVWKAFETNVYCALKMTQNFLAQTGDKPGHVSR